MHASFIHARLRRRHLPALIALALAGAPLAVTRAQAATLPVTSCADDDSAGTLRLVVASAHDGDTIDMTQLTCGTITLEQGVIAPAGGVGSLTFDGPGRDALTISGANTTSLLNFPDFTGVITLRDLTLAHGRQEANKYSGAGCLANLSNTVLERVTVTDCHAYDADAGAVFANGSLTLIDSAITDSSVRTYDDDGGVSGGGAWTGIATLIRSTISGNIAAATGTNAQAGGGGLSAYSVVMVDSVVSGNQADVTGDPAGAPGGGLLVSASVTILRSLIANNHADGDGGGLFKDNFANGSKATFSIQDSTFAGNTAGLSGGALYSRWPLTIANSTIADNYSASGGAVRLLLYETDYYGNPFVHGWPDFESTIVAGNTAGPSPLFAADFTTDAALTVFGAHDFIGEVEAGITLPPNTPRGDPMLMPLADNGGRSQTMAPLSGSPVIDAGFNPLGFNVDQRGPGFVRTYGTAADIGAYEVQTPPVPQSIRQPEPVKPVIAANHAPKVLPVTSCADDGSPGTLRAVAAQALDGDTIDMSGLTCSTITLTQGPIDTSLLGPNPLDQLTITGPGKDALTVSGNGASAVFIAGGDYRTGTSPLMTLLDLTVAHGVKYDAPGCVAAVTGSIELDGVNVTDCHSRIAGGGGVWPGHSNGGGAVGAAYAHVVASTISNSDITAVDRNVAAGGGLWAYQATLTNSTISGNSATAPVQYAEQGFQTAGGGVYTSGRLYIIDSTISVNSVEATEQGQDANGGGVAAMSVFTFMGSTFAENTADGIGGGAFGALSTYRPPEPTSPSSARGIGNSTFTGNSARLASAFATSDGLPVANSTVALNTSQVGGAVAILDGGTALQDYTLYLDSTIIANNVIDGPGGHAADLATSPNLTLTVIGSNNLVGSADPNVTLPPDTLNVDPMLLPLADNGGPTWTLALAPGSPAIDVGSNPWAFDTDQRGQGFLRVYGGAADIGAYEVQPTGEVIFASGFDN